MCLVLALCGCASAGAAPPAGSPAGATGLPAVLEVRDARLLPALQLLLERSPRVGSTLAGLGGDGARIRVHTYDSAPSGFWLGRSFAYGYTQAFYGREGRVDSVDIAIEWVPLHFSADALGLAPATLELEIAVILGHELFGHAVPLLERGTAAGECRDETTAGSCSVARENLVRADLGVHPRPDYLLLCLAVTRLRDEGAAFTRSPRSRRCSLPPAG